MSRITRFERDMNKLEKNIEKQQETIEALFNQLHHKKISEDVFSGENDNIVDRIRAMISRMQLLQGIIVKENRSLEEKKQEKENT
jgi:response regulator of citrate/malate metabolism